MHFLFLFLDGVGLGPVDPEINPFVAADMPNLESLLDGKKLQAGIAPIHTHRATLLALDPNLGVDGLPQSASGQATLITGRNVPMETGNHYGPKPNPPIAEIIRNGNIFKTLSDAGKRAVLLNAYPPGYFQSIDSGKRIYSAIPMGVTSAGIPLKTEKDFYAGRAMAAGFTGDGWRSFLKYDDSPLFTANEAGKELARLTLEHDFSFFEFWMSDYIGHKQNMEHGLATLNTFDQVLGGLLEVWDDQEGLILLTSDHGNMEDLSTRRHTANLVPGLVIGSPALREKFTNGLTDLAGVAGSILRMFDLELI